MISGKVQNSIVIIKASSLRLSAQGHLVGMGDHLHIKLKTVQVYDTIFCTDELQSEDAVV